MNKYNLFLVLFYAAVFGCIAASDDLQCTPNKTFQNDCNTCVCSEDGKSAACTLMGCIKLLPSLHTDASTTANADETPTTESISEPSSTESPSEPSSTESPSEPSSTESPSEVSTTESIVTESEHIVSNNHVCTPNDIKMEDCNRCRCAANGIGWFCTRRACPSKGFKKRAVQSPLTRCKTGTSWQDECNQCFCTDNETPVCTRMQCIRETKLVKRSAPAGSDCEPGSSWKDECNTCFCAETGIAACTLKGCLKKPYAHKSLMSSSHRTVTKTQFNDPAFSCTPSEAFKVECNICRCSQDGKSTASCTKKRCIDEE